MSNTEADILRAIRHIERLINEGWSISYARKVACGHSYGQLNFDVSKHPSYLPILNAYMNKRPQKIEYQMKNGMIEPIKKCGKKAQSKVHDWS